MCGRVRLICLAALLATGSARLAAPDPPPEPPPLLLGLLLPPEEAEALSLRQGVELAIRHANESGRPRAGLIIRGRVGQWGADGEEAARMTLDDGARALIASPGGVPSHLALQVAGRTATPVVSLCPDSSVTAAGIPWMVRLVPSTDQEAQVLFTRIAAPARGRPLRWGAVVPEGRAGREARRDLEVAARQSGRELQSIMALSAGQVGLTETQQTLLAKSAEGVLLWLEPIPAARVACGLRQAGFSGLLAGPGRLRGSTFSREAGQAAEGFFLATIALQEAETLERERFARTFRETFGAAPDTTAAMAHDAAMLLINLLRQSGTESLHRLFPLDRAFAGATGTLKFDRAGNRVVALALARCHHGDFELVRP